MEQENVVTDESAEEQAAFLAEMAAPEVADEQSPALEEASVEQSLENSTEANNAEVTEQEPEVEQRKEIFAGYTEDELKEALGQIPALRKSLDTTNGTYGARLAEQQKVIEELRQSRQQTVGKLTSDKLSRLSQEFPEIAEMLAEDLSDYIGTGGSASFDPDQINEVVSARVNEVEARIIKKEQELELRTLNRQHRDWREVASYTNHENGQISWNNPQFGSFVNTLPVEEQTKLRTEWDADFIAEKISAFKETIKPKVVKKQQIEAAVLPRGVGGRAISNDLDEEEAAYRAEMARR